jgi:surfeit locus 1 family protein
MSSPPADHSPRAFRAPPWAWVLTALAVAAFGSLGTWQLSRGLTKERLGAQLRDAGAPAIVLDATTPAPEPLTLVRATASGRYLPRHTLLLDGQPRDGQPGYRVWTPLELDGGGVLFVDRGWVAGRDALVTPPDGAQQVAGFWRTLPEPGVRLEATHNCPPAPVFPLAVLYPTADDLQCLLRRPVLPGLLLLDAQAPGGFIREWTAGGASAARHYGYAVQWFGLAVTAAVLFFVLNRRRGGAVGRRQ